MSSYSASAASSASEIPGSVPLNDVDLIPLWDGLNYFEHQVVGIHWMLEKEKMGTQVAGRRLADAPTTVYGGLQCDEMGLGKTIQMVATMLNHPQPLTVLLCPLAMVETWTEVCQRTGFPVFHAFGGGWVRQAGAVRSEEWKVYVTNFEKLYTTPRLFRGLVANRVVLDEAHKIRNPDGQMAMYARRLRAPIRWAMTGTPLVNAWRDVVSLLAFVGVPVSPLWRWEARFLDHLPDLVLHRSLEALRHVLVNAPPEPVIEHRVLPFVTEQEREFYLAIQGMAMSEVRGYDLDRLSSQEAFLLLLRLRQISVHPQVYISAKRRETKKYVRPNWVGESTKLAAIRDILREDLGGGDTHKYIVFCQFREEMRLLRGYIATLGLIDRGAILEYDGEMTQDERAIVLRQSKEIVGPAVLLIQLQAGGVGLNLQEYDRIIFNSPWWTSALMDQAIARAVRMGQRRVVRVIHLQLEAEAEEESAICIDRLISGKAEEKREMLLQFFGMCVPLAEAEPGAEEETADASDEDEDE
jgi:SNF2 family DNA or RNA helicase